MFISIPKEFFVEVIFDKKFILNKENNNMELDTDNYRENNIDDNDTIVYTELVDMNIEKKEYNKANEEILNSIDDEYVDDIIKVDKSCN